jgi:inosose dehydratase
MTLDRRQFVSSLIILGAGTFAPNFSASKIAFPNTLHIASNQYPWFTFFQRRGRNWGENLDQSLNEFASSGIAGFEPLVTSVEEIKDLGPLLRKHKLEMRSIYINSTLHLKDQAAESIKQAVSIAKAAQPLGVKIVVTNPSPIKWGTPEDKNDDQLKFQAESLDKLGKELKNNGITLSYHTHDMEMRNAAREFHHMMLNTDPADVTFCLDAHWVYRGSGDSQVALFDVVKMYGNRITEIHLRQSRNGIWTETFGEGDIDYRRLVKELKTLNIWPHLVLEQSIEKSSPDTMDAIEAHQKSLAYAKEVFSVLAG